MIMMDSVPIHDWMALSIGILGAVVAYIQSADRLPKWARKWMGRIGKDKVENAIDHAARLAELSADERRREAVAYLIRLTEKELGFAVPTSVANLLVEFVYQQWKRR